MDMLAEEKLRFFGSWCPHQQTVFCQNREGCSDCCIKEEYDMAAAVTTAPKLIAV